MRHFLCMTISFSQNHKEINGPNAQVVFTICAYCLTESFDIEMLWSWNWVSSVVRVQHCCRK